MVQCYPHMPTRSKRKTKSAKIRRLPKQTRTRKRTPNILTADVLGIAQEHFTQAQGVRSISVMASTAPPPNLPIAPHSPVRLREPLVAPRTSFWLGVGFGMLVVGTLVTIAWQLFRVETVEAIVVSLTRPR